MDYDPQFPDRPRHPDFDLLSAVVIDLDGNIARNGRYAAAREVTGRSKEKFNPFFDIVDTLSVGYMAKQRVALALKHFAEGKLDASSLDEVMQASWMEAFAAGVRFQQEGGHHSK